ncbi:MAG TPA: hypothetical protein PK823_10805 [Novosphingobium sp.]|nr:hypothetical protein [Novosphingobium sp.]
MFEITTGSYMQRVTDPAEEFAILCQSLAVDSAESGAIFLASVFEVEAWSFKFFQIIFCVVERAEYLRKLVNELPECSHIAELINDNLNGILTAFRASGMGRPWKDHGSPYLRPHNTGPIRILSASIRPKISYPSLTTEEICDVTLVVGDLIDWLLEHQMSENDFVRQALIDGLTQFKFRIDRLEWLGWGYALHSLKDVVSAYLALQKCIPEDNPTPLMKAFNQKVLSGIRNIYDGIGASKDMIERSDFVLKAYGASSIVLNFKDGGIAGLLTFAGK